MRKFVANFDPFVLALSFLSCLCSFTKKIDDDLLRASVKFFPTVGLVIGFCCTAPLFFLESYFFLQAWIYLILMFVITRGLHFDGLADLFDAYFSNAKGAKFQEILKDSRVGAFGAISLILACLGYVISVLYLCEEQEYLLLIITPMLSRANVLIFVNFNKVNEASYLGKFVDSAKSLKLGFLCLAIILLGLIFNVELFNLIIIIGLLTFLNYKLSKLSQRENGYNGDFLGAIIIMSELIIFTGSIFAI